MWKSLLERAGEEAMIVMDDIYWSKGMQRAWKEVKFLAGGASKYRPVSYGYPALEKGPPKNRF